MPRPGWIKLHHSLLDNPIWEERPFSKGQAWVDLLLLAESDEKDFTVCGTTLHQSPGSIFRTKKELMARWGWTKYKLNSVLAEWEALGMISVQQHRIQHRNQHRTCTEITIEKWRFFQGRPPKSSTENSTENSIHLKKNKKGGDGGSSPRPAGEVEVVKINGEWVARQK